MHKTIQNNLKLSSSSKEYKKFIQKTSKESAKKYYSDSQAMETAEYLFLKNNKNLNENVKIWTADSVFYCRPVRNGQSR